jgi:hypothetical protein
MKPWEKFTSWFFTEILGAWFIWASYMAVKFMSEAAQGQKASFSLLGNTQVGGLILIPVLATITFTLGSAAFWASKN